MILRFSALAQKLRLNIITILRLTLSGNDLGKFKRVSTTEISKSWSLNQTKNVKEIEPKQITNVNTKRLETNNIIPSDLIKIKNSWSLDQPDNEKIISKKVSLPPKIKNRKLLVKGKKIRVDSDDTSVMKIKQNIKRK